MKTNAKLIHKIEEALGGKWQATLPDASIQGYVATFKQFQANAIVGVVNASAERAGAWERAFSSACIMLKEEPGASCDVVIPKALATNPQFQQQLTADMRQSVAGMMSQQLSHAAMLGLHGR